MIEEMEKIVKGYFIGAIVTRIQVKDGTTKMETETVTVLTPKAISNGRIMHECLTESEIKVGSAVGKLTEAGDIVIKLTTPYESARVTEKDVGLLVPSYCMILRNLSSNIVPDYLVAFLNTEYAKQMMTAGVAASTNTMLKRKDIMSLKVPILPLEEQVALGKIYSISCQKQMVLNRMQRNEKELTDSLITEAVMEMIRNG